jgi:DNA polymerase-3 subunit delta'
MYAPMPFAAITGHRRTCDLLRAAVAAGRVPHSLLFSGPAGVGKHAVAVALAQAVNCPNMRDGDACGACSTCRRIAQGHHADVVAIDQGEKATIGVEPVRERLLSVVGYRPFEAARRVFIIDPADAMTEQTQDALLKTLEEPPRTTLLILITAYADTLAATVQSRCRRLRFGPLSDADVTRVLIDNGVSRGDAAALAASAGGSVGVALAEQTGFASEDREAAIALLASAARETTAGRLRAADKLVPKASSKRRPREAVGARLAIMTSVLRDLAAVSVGARDIDLDPEIAGLRHGYDARRATAAFFAAAEAQVWLEGNAGPKIVADWVALHL